MLYIIDWLTGKTHVSPHLQKLLTLDWRSSDEFLGYLVRVLEGLVDEKLALKGGYTKGEKSWLHYVVSLIREKQGNLSDSEELLKEAVLMADIDDWVFFLAFARLGRIQKQRMLSLKNKVARADYQGEMEAFAQNVREDHNDKKKRQAGLAPLIAWLKQESVSPGVVYG